MLATPPGEQPLGLVLHLCSLWGFPFFGRWLPGGPCRVSLDLAPGLAKGEASCNA